MNVAPEPVRLATDTVKVTRDVSQRQVHRLFAAGVFKIGVDGVLETIGGILFIMNHAYDSVFAGETVGHHSSQVKELSHHLPISSRRHNPTEAKA